MASERCIGAGGIDGTGVAIHGVTALARCVGAGVSTSWISPGTIDEPALELFTTSVLGEGVSVISIGAGASAGWNSVRAIDETGLGAAASVIIAARSSAVCTGSGALARWICSGAHCKAAIGAGAEGKTALGVGAQGSTELGEGAQGNTALGEGAQCSTALGEGAQGNTAVGTGMSIRGADQKGASPIPAEPLYRNASGDTSNASKPKK